MSDHGIANGNNCTALAYPEEAVTETLRPLAERLEQQEDKPIDASDIAAHPVAEADAILEQGSVSLGDGVALEAQQVEEETHPGPSQDTDHEPNLPAESHIPLPPSSSLDVPSPVNTEDPQSHSEGLRESPAPPSPDPDSFSESFTHVSPCPEEPSLLSPLTLGGTDYLQDEEELLEGAEQQPNGEGLGPAEEDEDEAADQARSEVGRHADSPAASSGLEEVPVTKAAGEEESGVRRRSPLLAALEPIGQREEEEEAEEEFQIPQRVEEEAGFSLNKCILGAVILVGLGTILFSGVFMDLDNEGEYDSRELRDVPMQGKQDWPNPEVPVPPVDVLSPDHDKQLAKDDQHIATLHAQLQAQKEELKVTKGQSAEGAKERQRKEEVEKENGRLKKELASLAALHKENERMKRELESVAALQREVETLRATVTDLRVPTDPPPAPWTALPPSGQAEIRSQDPAAATVEKEAKTPWQGEKKEKNKEWKKEKQYNQGEKAKDRKDMGEKEWREGGDKYQKEEKEWKKGEKHQKKETEWKKGGEKYKKEEKEWEKRGEKEWKKGGEKYQKEEKEWKTQHQEKEGKGKKDWKDKGEWKKEKTSRGGEGKPWGDKKEWKGMEWKDEEKEWKNHKYEKRSDGKEWKSKSDKKEKRGGKDEEWWNPEKEWKKEKEGKESSRGWRKDRGERKDGKQKDDYKHGHKEGKGKENEWSKDGEPRKKGWKEGRKDEEWRKDSESHQHHHKDGHKHSQYEQHQHSAEGDARGQRERAWQSPGDKKPPHTHRRPPLERPDYWEVQRERLQHSPKPQTHCSSVETCAQAEGLLPVPLPVFEAVLQGYLTKAEEAGVEASKREELSKLVTEFFKDGVFAHHQMSFLDFVEDVGDILEDMVESDGEEEEDEALEEEMDGFEAEMVKTFALQREEKKTGEWKKASGRGRA